MTGRTFSLSHLVQADFFAAGKFRLVQASTLVRCVVMHYSELEWRRIHPEVAIVYKLTTATSCFFHDQILAVTPASFLLKLVDWSGHTLLI